MSLLIFKGDKISVLLANVPRVQSSVFMKKTQPDSKTEEEEEVQIQAVLFGFSWGRRRYLAKVVPFKLSTS